MKEYLPSRIFVSGTDTGIGKTVVSAMLMSSLDATYWKPTQSGLDEETDTQFVQRVSEVPESRIIPERYRLNEPMSPHSAADIDNVKISLNDFQLPEYDTDHLIVEGAGGLWVPINWKESMMDLILHLNIPVLLVARSTLGTLNHTLLSLEALRNRGIDIIGVVMNGPEHEENKKTIEHFGNVKVWEINDLPDINKNTLKNTFNSL
ncbi:dethiobiotin synthase [Balneola sp. MJW-20]|uniref:dethiobiotin synthase n=1 Tax=Gracilimonas aurantiaca TaxID=3234185 RepID=UPI0034B11E92